MKGTLEPMVMVSLLVFLGLCTGAVFFSSFAGNSASTEMAAVLLGRSGGAKAVSGEAHPVNNDDLLFSVPFTDAAGRLSGKACLVSIRTPYGNIMADVWFDGAGNPSKALRLSSSGSPDVDNAADIVLKEYLSPSTEGRTGGFSSLASSLEPVVGHAMGLAAAGVMPGRTDR